MRSRAILASLLALGLHAAAAERPNFLFILTDDQRWDALGVVQREQGERARFPWFKTPNLDRLAAEGARFRNAFVVNSLCAPSRASFLSGQYGHRNGVVNNHTDFPAANVTHASLLRAAGYRTGYVGKWHMGKQAERPGFDFFASYIGQGKYFDCPMLVDGKETETKGWVDDVATEHALRFVRENRERPFSLVIGYKATHGPFTPPERHAKTFEGESARPVPNLDIPAIYRASGEAPRRGKRGKGGAAPATNTNLGYFRCLAAMDDNVGRVLDLLDELKLAGRTVVVFAGDNGYYLGEHGLGDKRSAYDESLRIPLLLRYPGVVGPGRTIDEMVLNIDLAPTFLELAGLPVPQAMHGRSWRALLEGRKEGAWRDSYFYCYFAERGFNAIPTVTAVRTAGAKLIRYPGHDEWTELFDLASDPYETRNLIADPARVALRRELEAEYERQRAAIAFEVPPFADAPGVTRLPAGLDACVLDYRFDKDDAARVADASGRGNHGAATRAPLAEGRQGKRARRFAGDGSIDVPKTPSLNPAVAVWTVEIEFLAERPDGILLAHGGQTRGMLLGLRGGRPFLALVNEGDKQRVEAGAKIEDRWTRLRASIDAGAGVVKLWLDGREVASAKAIAAIDREPNDPMQIGADLRSPVLEQAPPPFSGIIESVRVWSGRAPAPAAE